MVSNMDNILVQEINNFDWKLVSRLEELEKRNLGSKASINCWVIPVIIRYGKFIVAQKSKNDTDIIGVCELIRDWECIKKGVVKKLLGKLIDILRNENFKEVELTADPGNESAVSLNKSFGFKRFALRENE